MVQSAGAWVYTGRRRKDDNWCLGAGIDYALLPQLDLFLHGSATRLRSNIAGLGYHQELLQTGIRVELPQVTRIEPQVQKDVVVTITAAEELYVDGIKVSWTLLRERLGSRLRETGSKTVIVKGDEAVRLGRTVQVMDIARQLGAEQLAIAARSLADEERP